MVQQACLSCRASKIRCTLDTFAHHGKCRRCYASGIECVFSTVKDKPRRKRTDTRVTALEKQVSELRATVESLETAHPARGVHAAAAEDQSSGNVGHDIGQPRSDSTDDSIRVSSNAGNDSSAAPSPDGSNWWLEFLSLHDGEALFSDFVHRVLPQYPILSISEDTDFYSLHSNQPILAFAIITSSSRSTDPALFRKLHTCLLRVLAEQVILQGKRDATLLQAMLASEVWYDPPDDMNNLNFYMWIQLVAVMGQQLGLLSWGGDNPSYGGGQDEELVHLRSGLAVYLSVSSAAISLRRPTTMRWSRDLSCRLEKFQDKAHSANDRRLVAWIKLQRIAEQVEDLRLKLSETPASNTLFRSAVRELESAFAEWQYQARDVMNESLRVHFHYCRCKLYELAVKICQSQQSTNTQPDHAQYMDCVRMVMSLLQASHSILDALIYLDVETYLRCPTVTTVRALYAIKGMCTLEKTSRDTYLAGFVGEALGATRTYKMQVWRFLEQAGGRRGFQVPLLGLKSIGSIIDGDELNGQDDSTGQRRRVAGRTPNEMEEILQVDFDGGGCERQIVVASSEAHQDVDGYTQGSMELGDGRAMADFEMMMMPEDIIDPGWLSAGLGLIP